MKTAPSIALACALFALGGCELWRGIWSHDAGPGLESTSESGPGFENPLDGGQEIVPEETDEEAYHAALLADTPGALIDFLEAYPGSPYAPEAIARLETISIRESGGAPATNGPDSPPIRFSGGAPDEYAKQLAAYRRARMIDNIDEYRWFLEDYPESPFAEEVRERIAFLDATVVAADRAATQSTTSSTTNSGASPKPPKDGRPDLGINPGYLLNCVICQPPADEAAFIEASRLDTIAAYTDFLRDYPASIWAGNAREQIAWLRASQRTYSYGSSYGRVESNPGISAEEMDLYHTRYQSMSADQAFAEAFAEQGQAPLIAFLNIYGSSQYAPFVREELERRQSPSSPVASASIGANDNELEVVSLSAGEQSGLAMLGWDKPTIKRTELEVMRLMFPNDQAGAISQSPPVTGIGSITNNTSLNIGADIQLNTAVNGSFPTIQNQGFDEGRIIHHAPTEMVLGESYFLEVAIQPITANTTVIQIDANLTATLGSGNAPRSEAPALARSTDTIAASELMSAKLVGNGFDITATSETLQPLFPNQATVWQWEVIPTEAGNPNLTFSVSKSLVMAGREVNQTVKTIPLTIEVESIDDLLAEEPIIIASSMMPAADSLMTGFATPMAASRAAPEAESVLAKGVCETKAGSDPDRLALLLTNLEYTGPISRLSETHRDGERLSESLNAVGFTVTHCRDLGRARSISELSRLGRAARARTQSGAEPVTFFYYSGHGVNIDGTNYVLPVDMPGITTDDVRDGGVKFEEIFNRVSKNVAPLSFVVFDACRTVMADGSKGLMRTYEPVRWSRGTFQAFATEPGEVAIDDGLYSATLASLMKTIQEPANVLFKRVQDEVAEKTNDMQIPEYWDRTRGGEFYFKSG